MTRGLPCATRPNRFRQVMPGGVESLCAVCRTRRIAHWLGKRCRSCPAHGAVAETDAHFARRLGQAEGGDRSRTMAVMSVAAADRSGRLEDALGERSDCRAE